MDTNWKKRGEKAISYVSIAYLASTLFLSVSDYLRMHEISIVEKNQTEFTEEGIITSIGSILKSLK